MAHLTSKDQGVRIDNAAGTLASISGSVNSQAIERAVTILDDTGMGDTGHTTLQGLSQTVRIPLNGFVNATVDAIFGPVADGTSKTKTVEIKVSSTRYYNGEFWVENYNISGSPDTLQAWSATLVSLDSEAINRTSKALS